MSQPIDIKQSDALPRRHSVYEEYAMQHSNPQHPAFSSYQYPPHPMPYYTAIPPGSPPRNNASAFLPIFKPSYITNENFPANQSAFTGTDASPDPIKRLKSAFSKHACDHPNSGHSPYLTVSPPLSPSLQTGFPASSATFRRHSNSSSLPSSLPTQLTQPPLQPTEQESVVSPTSPKSNRDFFFRERHHVRRPSVAINFSDSGTDADDQVVDLKSGVRERRDSFMKRPPSPLAECILKGDFSFD